MNYKCVTCHEEFEGSKGNSGECFCPYCDNIVVDENMYRQLNAEMKNKSYSKEDIENLLKQEDSILNKIKNSSLEKVSEQIKALFTMLKDPDENMKNKVSALAPLLYVLNPMDFVPDFVPVLGYMDDCAAVALAVTLLGREVSKYIKSDTNNKKGVDDKLVIYDIYNQNASLITSFELKKGIVTWRIPKDKTKMITIDTINNKMFDCNEKYIKINSPEQLLVPIKDFDKTIVDNIFNEALIVLKALGVKSVSWKMELAEAHDKKAKTKMEQSNVFSADSNLEIKKISKVTQTNESHFECSDLLETLRQNNFVDKLCWFFTNKSIVSEEIISDRFEKNLKSTKITKEIEIDSLLNTENRLKIQKNSNIGIDFSMSLYTKAKWEIDIEYYSLCNEDRAELMDIYNSIKSKIDKRRTLFK